MIFLVKSITLLTKSWITTMHIYIFLHITLVTSLSTVDSPNISESNFIYRYKGWYTLCSDSNTPLSSHWKGSVAYKLP